MFQAETVLICRKMFYWLVASITNLPIWIYSNNFSELGGTNQHIYFLVYLKLNWPFFQQNYIRFHFTHTIYLFYPDYKSILYK